MVEEEESWQDPLLITDVSFQEHQHHSSSSPSSGHNQQITKNPIFPDPQSGSSKFTDPISLDDISGIVQSSKPAQMEHPNPHLNAINSIFRQERSLEGSRSGGTPRSTRNKTISWQNQTNPEVIDGRSLLGFSLTTPDLVICTGSPDTPNTRNNDMFEFRQNVAASIELSLDNGIDGGDDAEVMYHTPNQDDVNGSTDFSRNSLPVICVNSGGLKNVVPFDGVEFVEDSFFTGGDVVEATTRVEDDDGEGLVLYKSARCGDFSYKFDELEAGDYIVDLHFAEIVFTSGPPGMRVFNVYIQDEKVLSAIDIYAQVGSNKPLILPDLRASVDGKGSLWIKFEGVIGKPIVCGISVWKDSQEEFRENLFHKGKESSQRGENEAQDIKLQRELAETKRALRGIKKEYELKSKECQEAWKSLRELQNELMRKSMHVGSLAYAIEGQVKEKSRWFISLRDLTKRIKILKIEHKKLSEEAMECKKCVGDVNQMAAIVQSAINQKLALEREHEDLKLKFTEGAKERKALYNKVLELKGNIRVFCRCRPLNIDEIAGGASMAIDFESAKDGELAVRANGTSKKVFKFDSVFCPQADQADVFEDTAPFATSVLDGFNVCIFAYGQTGTGKTFTMEGTEEARGVNYRTLNELFHIIRDRQGLYRYEVSVSVLEVYNEQIRDLLVPGSQPSINSKRLEIKQVADGIHHVPGLVEAHVNNMNEVWDVLQTGSNSRAVGATNANEHSSRSHCIHCVMVKGENLMNGECTRSKLWLVDLAGSERVAKTDVQGDRLKETQNINRSLSALGDVIFALATKSLHIPFRNSKLTHLLQDSLGGDSKTLMFLQISPNENDLSETLCSLNFASRVRGIELGPAKKQFDSSELIKYKQMAEKAKQDIKSKEGYIKKLEDNIYGLESKAKARDLNNKSLQEKVKELESQLMVERRLARQHVDSKIAEQQQQQQKQLQDEQTLTSGKPLVSTQPFGNHKKASEPTTNALAKDEPDHIRPLTEKNSFRPSLPPPTDTFSKYSFTEKENKPDMTEHPVMPRRTGRLSICPTSHHIPEASNPRRNSLIPLPMSGRVALAPTVVPLQAHNSPEPMQDGIQETDVNNPEKTPPCTLRGPRTGSKKINGILRRSLQKKVQIKSPMQQNRRGGGGGLNGGMEKVRLSIGGGKGRAGLRARGAKELTNQKEKEKRGWNF